MKCLLVLVAVIALPLSSQSISGYSTIHIDPSSYTANVTCETDLNDGADDGTLAARASCSVVDDNGNSVTFGTKTDDGDNNGYAAVNLTFQATAGVTYFVDGRHSASNTTPSDSPDAPRSPSNQQWVDLYNFEAYTDGGFDPIYPASFDWPGYGPERSSKYQFIQIGDTFDMATAGPSQPDQTPVISGIDPSVWTPGQTTTVTIDGQYFGGSTNLQINPSSGISYTWVSQSDTQLVINVSVAPGTPDESVQLSVTSNGASGMGFAPGPNGNASSSTANAQVRSPRNSPEITVVGWIDPTASDLSQSNLNALASRANSNLVNDLQHSCLTTLFSWTFRGNPVDVVTQADRDFANVWGIANTTNSDPGSSLLSVALTKTRGNYRLFNDFGSGHQSVAVGSTPNPCHSSSAGAVGGWVGSFFFGKGQGSTDNGKGGVSNSGYQYQVAEVRVGTDGQSAYRTINNGRTVPWVWAVVEIGQGGAPLVDSAGNVAIPDRSQFPTLSVFRNGTLVNTYHQGSVLSLFSNDETNQPAWIGLLQ